VRLLINGEPIDFTLEKEAAISEVVKGVEEWLARSGFLATRIRMGDQDLLSLPRSEWETIPIVTVAELDFTARHTGDLRREHWTTVRAWLGSLAEAVSGRGTSLEALLADLPATLETLKENPFDRDDSSGIERITALFLGQEADDVREWPPARVQSASELIKGISDRLAHRIEEALNPRSALKSYIGELRDAEKGIREVSVLLQTGRDKEAMDTVVSFTGLVQRLLDLVRFLPRDPEREKLFEELNPVLREIVTAFDAKDLVLIGDLFEYEVAPRIARLLPLLDGSA
jgi:hypothetical protein